MYKEIIVETTSEGADFIAGIFFSLGAQGVTISDPNDIDEVLKDKLSWDYVEENLMERRGGPVFVSCFVSSEDCQRKIEDLKDEMKMLTDIDTGSLAITVRDYVEYDWLSEWKKYYKPIRAGGFTVVPEWQSYVPTPEETVIRIDPTMAFGTGEHESTKLCLELLSETDVRGKNVIDVGCGSGILGIGAALKGAEYCYLCDIDSLAVRSANDNARLNNVLRNVTIEESDLFSKTGLVADIVLANLTADILIRLSEGLPAHIKKDGVLICSGIIHKRKQAVMDCFTALGFKLGKEKALGDWDALEFIA
jgi:ribosomal protein L11 methyltransferase